MSQAWRHVALAALLFGAFVSQLGYAVAQPLLPMLLDRIGASVSLHTGLLTGTYAAALFLFAPLWGAASDRWPRRTVFLAGLGGFALAALVLSFVGSLTALYAGLFLAGGFSAAIWPIALALVADRDLDVNIRGRHFSWIYGAVTAGLLTGPALGGLLGGKLTANASLAGLPFLLIGTLAAAAALLAAWTLPSERDRTRTELQPASDRAGLIMLLLLSLLVGWGTGTFEVVLTLRAAKELGLGPGGIGWLFVDCMLVMVATQLLLSWKGFIPEWGRFLLAPTFALLGLTLLGMGYAGSLAGLALAVSGVAAALGMLSPIIGYSISSAAGDVQGTELGRVTAAASLGQGLGASTAGLLYGAGIALALAASLAVLGALLGARLWVKGAVEQRP